MHRANLKYLAKHKRFVFLAGLNLGVSLWRLLVHDWSKLTPTEWFGYAKFFYGPKEAKRVAFTAAEQRANVADSVKAEFDRAWLFHQNRNDHHWQFWVLLRDDGSIAALEMPRKCVLEMIADWRGAGAAVGKPDTLGWYGRNRSNMLLHWRTRLLVEHMLGYVATACAQCGSNADVCVCQLADKRFADLCPACVDDRPVPTPETGKLTPVH